MRWAAFLIGVCLSTGVYANIGTVTELTGAAVIKRGKESVTVAKGTVIEQNDRVETKNGKLKIVFKDDTQVSVTEHSSLLIDDFVYDPSSKSGKLGLKAASGTVRYVSGAIAKDPKNVNIKTPTAAIAVRGTDFVMSVNEVGSSMVILMPSCDWESAAMKGASCSSGKIDVESGPTKISMDRPYQATLVESAGQPPTPPITVNLFNTPVGNNLQITPPRTMGGASVVAAARAAAQATGVIKENKKEDKEDKEAGEEKAHASDKKNSTAKKSVASKNSKPQQAETTGNQETEEKTTAKVEEVKVETNLAAAVVENITSSLVSIAQSSLSETVESKVSSEPEKEKENPNVRKIWKDKSQTVQVGWAYESLSATNRNYANVTLPIDTKAMVIVTQDGQTNGYQFGMSKGLGQIVITQTSR